MKNTPIDYQIVRDCISKNGLISVGKASIREIKKLVDDIEQASGQRFIRMEMGNPGLPPAAPGVKAQIEALEKGIASEYPDIQGIPPLKKEISRFLKLFVNIDVDPQYCFATVGSMQGSFASFLTVNRMTDGKNKTLFIDPGFPVHKQQVKVLGQPFKSFDVYDYRGERLRDKLEEELADGTVASLIYSNPNNPAWFCFNEQELQIIAEVATKHDVVVIEDLAYFGMDFRKDYGQPGQPPYQPSIARFYDKYILLISSSKIFSYAGERIACLIISPKLYHTNTPDLKKYYGTDSFGHAFVFGTLYTLSSGTAHSPQCALSHLLKLVNDGEYHFLNEVREYGEKAAIMKKMFLENGFRIVYDKDLDVPIGDGFYFTFSYPGFSGDELLEEMIYYGISAITLDITGSQRKEGIRACVSLVHRDQFPDLECRLKRFHIDHPI
ncbi:MAG TPA: pyridoxal phosphate-dependent aminotransferase [Bacteroidales bacterium]|jgi:aspartate/methionine/tyrosine aminotransferase|nr:pyridoxal phosphate-dependent aminotransferase [Bacteroidales bacterium]MDI9573488.1 pyridoxal phosphate-dependent aminotransferase [Bacteroidota bacterium]OQC59944.1 MAG: Glutamate-pyruvate aminotransferase AlaC [Bacteroidetes bacterium ADurb.Bin012]MBP9512075.1 pyridoxal phosphate-dependent aminotransferase [Bacteroidales bacterium]MBP9588856.1 pyridoxal phosphate-dependent aminotransferase [Bacteroidales bacterium]